MTDTVMTINNSTNPVYLGTRWNDNDVGSTFEGTLKHVFIYEAPLTNKKMKTLATKPYKLWNQDANKLINFGKNIDRDASSMQEDFVYYYKGNGLYLIRGVEYRLKNNQLISEFNDSRYVIRNNSLELI
jgi:hypothetical protein